MSGRPWTNDEDKLLIGLYENTDRFVLLDKLDRSWDAIMIRARSLKVKRSHARQYPSEGLLVRFYRQYVINDITGCWDWVGRLDPDGYSVFFVERVGVRGHRFSYEKFVGPIESGNVIHHKCHNKACINPEHLEQMTPVAHKNEHVVDAHKKQVFCVHGHEFTEENTYWYPNQNKRKCRACRRVGGKPS